MRVVAEGENGLVLKYGKYVSTKDPGLIKINPYLLGKVHIN